MSVVTWVLYDQGKIGSKHHCIGLANALGLNPVQKVVAPRWPWSVLPGPLWFCPLSSQSTGGDPLDLPYPNLIISSGRAAASLALGIAKAIQKQKNKCYLIHILDPHLPIKHFDLVITPEHDNLMADNVIVTRGGVHHLTDALMTECAKNMDFSHLKRPYLGVLLGGNSQHVRFTEHTFEQLAGLLKDWQTSTGGSILVTPSRRTPLGFIQKLQNVFEKTPFYMWDQKQPNPYPGLLGWADSILVTSDSVSMMSEALFVGKPTAVMDVGINKKKFKILIDSLERDHYITVVDRTLFFKEGKKLDECQRILPLVRSKLESSDLFIS